MSEQINKGTIILAGVTTVAMAAAVVGHMFALDWVGRKLREFVRPA